MSTADPFGTWQYAGGRARTVEKALLAHEHEGMFGDATPRHVLFALGDLVERPAEVHGPRAKAVSRPPRNRPIERVVELEHART